MRVRVRVISKTAKTITEKPENDPIPSLRYADAFRVKQETEEVTKAMSSITLNEISDFKGAATDMRYFARSKFSRGIVHKKNCSLI